MCGEIKCKRKAQRSATGQDRCAFCDRMPSPYGKYAIRDIQTDNVQTCRGWRPRQPVIRDAQTDGMLVTDTGRPGAVPYKERASPTHKRTVEDAGPYRKYAIPDVHSTLPKNNGYGSPSLVGEGLLLPRAACSFLFPPIASLHILAGEGRDRDEIG